MTINLIQLTALLPLFILMLTIITSMFSIACKRNHFLVYTLTLLGLLFSCFSLYFSINNLPVNIHMLFYMNKNSILYMSMIVVSSISTCIFAYPWIEKSLFNKEEFYLLILFSTLGALALIISCHMSSFFISIELLSLPILGLISYSKNHKYSLESALKYILLSSVTSSFLLFGIAWIYAVSGSLSFSSISTMLYCTSFQKQLVILFGISMILLSLFFKLSVVPFHLWTPDIYQGTPAVVLSFFSTVGKISVFSVLLTFCSHISKTNNLSIYKILLFATFFSILFGNLMALFQTNIKRFLGYASISQLGYLLVVLLVCKKNYLFSLETSAIYLFSYLLSNISCFGIISLFSTSNNNHEVDCMSSYRGLFWSYPGMSILLTIILMSLAGIPITLGFFGKFYILTIIIKEQLWIANLAFFIGTILGIYCYLRMIINLYLTPLNLMSENIILSSRWIYSPSGIVVLVSTTMLLILGFYPNKLIHLVHFFIS